MVYNWQQPDWPDFRYDLLPIEDALFAFARDTAHTSGMLKALPDGTQTEAIISTMVAEAIKTSAIEGEYLNRQDVVSSIRNKLGLNKQHARVADKKALGAGELMVAVRDTYKDKLTDKMLFAWHSLLLKDSSHISTGAWRTHEDAMQVISRAIGKEKVHFEAPPSSQVPYEMDRFIEWFNDTAPGAKREIKMAPIRSAIAHLYFESIHPFEDGNGRIGRAMAEKALSQTTGWPILLSLSNIIDADKKSYYDALKSSSRSNEITKWIRYFAGIVFKAQTQAQQLIDFTLQKTRFFDRYNNTLNDRQLKAIKKMLDAGPNGFEGGMTATKYISITKTSKATATRDLQALLESGILKAEGNSRNTHYLLNL